MAAFGDENVVRLDIAMDDAFGMGGIKGVCDFDGQREHSFLIQGLTGNAVPQCYTIEELHGDKVRLLLVVDLVDGADIRMVKGGGGLSFSLEPAQGLRILGHAVRQELQRDKASKLEILGFVDNSHSPAAESLYDAVVRDG